MSKEKKFKLTKENQTDLGGIFNKNDHWEKEVKSVINCAKKLLDEGHEKQANLMIDFILDEIPQNYRRVVEKKFLRA